ncbi:SAGA-associated factor 73 [Yarrowia sp. C11]|nr:SAGA-associated factor 73 [Yarrowia sp. C11]KAG5371121.1 SAGA-associated factor 73 [Yarrowia sp. E02]
MLSRLVPQALLKRAFGDESEKVVPQTNGTQYKRRKQDGLPKTASDISDSILQWSSPADSDRPSLHTKDSLLLASLNPITAPLSYQVCKHCERPVIGDTNVHLQRCAVYQVSRIQKERDSTSSSTTKVTKRSANTAATKDAKETKEVKAKKEKAEKAPPAPRRSKPREAKSKASTKGKVVDVDKQCGVPLPNGGLCARSLTCKTHAMGAKRAVQGRSAPYDALLADLQRRNQLKLQQRKDGTEEEEEPNVIVDPETEVKMVLEAVQRSTPVPLERKVLMPARISNGFFRMREMLAGALINNTVADPTHQRSAAAIGGLIGQATAFYAGDPGQLYHLKPQYETKKK